MTVVATVGTTHPLCFAGLTFAVQVLAAEAVRPVTVVAGVSAQDAGGVRHRQALDAETIAAQFAALADAEVAAFHVGSLLSAGAVRAVAAGLARYPEVPVVVDPVLTATGGGALADPETGSAIRETLLARATLVTPNLDEAAELAGVAPIETVAEMERAAEVLRAAGAQAVLVKGGHLRGDAIDVLVDDRGPRAFAAPRVAGELRGTGDLLAATIAAGLGRGASLREAIEHARHSVREAIARGVPFAGTRVATLRDH